MSPFIMLYLNMRLCSSVSIVTKLDNRDSICDKYSVSAHHWTETSSVEKPYLLSKGYWRSVSGGNALEYGASQPTLHKTEVKCVEFYLHSPHAFMLFCLIIIWRRRQWTQWCGFSARLITILQFAQTLFTLSSHLGPGIIDLESCDKTYEP
jgi:hypothetical protein